MIIIQFALQEELLQVRLSKLSVDGLYHLLKQIDDLRPTLEKLGTALHQHSINGRVLMNCDLAELKTVLELNFGNWEIFRLLITGLREIERTHPVLKFNIDQSSSLDTMDTYSIPIVQRQKTTMEKQVSVVV